MSRLDEIRERVEAQPRDYDLETIEGRINASFDLVMADGDRAWLLAEVEQLRGALEGLGGPGGLHIFRHVDLEEFCPVCGFPAWTHDPATAFLFSQQPARALGAPETREGEKP